VGGFGAGGSLGVAEAVTQGNALSDFPPDAFAIMTFCESCGHQGQVDRDRVPAGVTVHQLSALLRCSQCGAKAGSIRIV
jgi:hypothetical protein